MNKDTGDKLPEFPKQGLEEQLAGLYRLAKITNPPKPSAFLPRTELAMVATMLFMKGIITTGRLREHLSDCTLVSADDWTRFLAQFEARKEV